MNRTSILNNFLLENHFNETAKYIAESDSYYDDGEELIVLGGLTVPTADEIFIKYCHSLGLSYEVDIEVLSFLHELGHGETLHIATEEDELNRDLTIMLCNLLGVEDEEDFMMYFTTPIEAMATEWAVNFCNENIEKVKELERKILCIVD